MITGLLTMFGAGACADITFFGLIPWYHYLTLDSNCQVPNFTVLGAKSDLLLVILAIVDDLLRVAGIVAVGYVIYAGIKYITSQGSPDETAKAQSTLLNAIIGLAIALVAVASVSFLGNQLAGPPVGTPTTSGIDVSSLPKTAATNTTVSTLLSIVFSVVGALSLLFITIGGFRYVISQGDPQATAKAKHTIIYAVVGLVVAIFAQIIVTFVIGRA